MLNSDLYVLLVRFVKRREFAAQKVNFMC